MTIRSDIVLIGASAGGVEALQTLLAGLPSTLSAALLIVLHRSVHSSDVLVEVLQRVSSLPVSYPKDGDSIASGHIYLAPTDKHLLVEVEGDCDRMRLSSGPKERWQRPSIDLLFRSGAVAFGPRVIGIILSGYLNDGTAGLREVKDRGGIALVQSPEDALADPMPLSAIQHVTVDHVLPVAVMANEIVHLVQQSARRAESGERLQSLESGH